MRKVLLAFGIGAAFVFSAAVAFANPPIGIVVQSNGTYGPPLCVADTCVGELLACPFPEDLLSPVHQTYYFIRGVCDDRNSDGLPRCAGRYVSYGEECTRVGSPVSVIDDEHKSGTDDGGFDFVTSRQTDGAFRVCYSDDAKGEADCAGGAVTVGEGNGSDPDAEVIATGTTRSHTNRVLGTNILLGVGEAMLNDEGRKWIDEDSGEEHEWGKDETVGEHTVVHSQAQLSGDRCSPSGGTPGPCGLSQTGVAANNN